MIKLKKRARVKAKPASEAQKRARERNWNKGQMRCIIAIAEKTYKAKTTHEIEKIELRIIIDASNLILQNWNK